MIKEIFLQDNTIITSIESLMYEHFNEVSKSKLTLNVNWELYKTLQEKSILIALGAFEDDLLVGYAALVVTEPPHYMGHKIAVSDTIFVHKNFRKSTHGLKLISIAEKLAKERGALEVHWYSKPDSNLDKLFEKKKYTCRDVVRQRSL